MSPTGGAFKHTNRLIDETSPYLLQHAHNPVDWYPWGAEALARAVKDDRLILLSIGYSACHWCHVMERESFEDEAIAAIMNANFVNVKVDREERPDLDEIYMAATVAMNQGQGGWPMTVFLTPGGEPVFAGTYFPPTDRYGRPGFVTVLHAMARAWEEDRGALHTQAARLLEHLRNNATLGGGSPVGVEEIRGAVQAFSEAFDEEFGGFGPAPKFPPATGLSLLLRAYHRFNDTHALAMVEKTLTAMAYSGMYDQIGGGFARYATDRRWLIPHFEKMLYDNALLSRVYLEAVQATGTDLYRRIASETLDYVLREMTSPEGGFYSSTDADSEGVEGKYFVWTRDDVIRVLGETRGRWFNAYYDISDAGNWEGTNIPNCPRPMDEVAAGLNVGLEELRVALASARNQLYEARLQRVPPGLDDKVLTAWNGLMIGALADGYHVLGDPRYLHAARAAAAFVSSTLTKRDGRLLRTYRAGKAHLAAYLEDYAYLSEGLLNLYEAGGDPVHLSQAERLLDVVLAQFADVDSGGFFQTAHDHEELILRYREGTDGAVPSANATTALALARISYHLDRPDFRAVAERAGAAYGDAIARYPRAFAKSLIVADFLLDGPIELALVGTPGSSDYDALRNALSAHYLPNRIQALRDPSRSADHRDLPLLKDKGLVNGRAALYVCQNFACQSPVTDSSEVATALGMARDVPVAQRAEPPINS